MDLRANYFELFGLPARFAIDAVALDRAYRDLQNQVHPDRFAHLGDSERRLSMQWATQANAAYRTLKRPLPRAQYLLQLAGVDIAAESNTAMAPAFLMEQMEWREAVADAAASGDAAELESLRDRLQDSLDQRYGELTRLFDEDAAAAGEAVRKLMFLERLAEDIDAALADIEDAAP